MKTPLLATRVPGSVFPDCKTVPALVQRGASRSRQLCSPLALCICVYCVGCGVLSVFLLPPPPKKKAHPLTFTHGGACARRCVQLMTSDATIDVDGAKVTAAAFLAAFIASWEFDAFIDMARRFATAAKLANSGDLAGALGAHEAATNPIFGLPADEED